jgi:hypothetical protein
MTFQGIFQLLFFVILMSNAYAQHILVLERPGTIKNYKYYQHDEIRLKTSSTQVIYQGKITAINDSSIVVNYANEIFIDDMAKIYTFQWGFDFLRRLGFSAGALFLAVSLTNGGLNGFDSNGATEMVLGSVGIMAFSAAMIPLKWRGHKIDNTKWRVKILDFNK